MPVPARRILPLLLLLAGCTCASGDPATAVANEGDGVAAADPAPLPPIEVGDWAGYAAPAGEEWPVEPLDAARWAQVTAELACAARAKHGDPDAQRDASRRVLAHHRTTAQDVMGMGVEINADAEQAFRLGDRVASAIERCR